MLTGKIPPHHELLNLRPPEALSQAIDPDQITKAAKHLGRFTTGHVLEMLSLPLTRGNEMAVAKQVRSLGYVKARVTVSGSQHWVFFPPPPAAPAACFTPPSLPCP